MGNVRTAIITHDNVDHYGALADAAPWIGLESVLVSEPALGEVLRLRVRKSRIAAVELAFAPEHDLTAKLTELQFPRPPRN